MILVLSRLAIPFPGEVEKGEFLVELDVPSGINRVSFRRKAVSMVKRRWTKST